MRKGILLFLLIVSLAKLQAQNYLISFEGSGASATVESISVENLTQGTSLLVGGSDQLLLLGSLSVADPGSAGGGRLLLVYPNPSIEEVNLIFEATSSAKTIIELSDVPTASTTITFAFSPCTDYDNNNYTIVQIGSQTWMEDNLKSTHYPDGTTTEYFDYDHDPVNSSIYGRLYAWSPAMNGAASSNTNPSNVQGVCPNGWHLPSKSEWQQLGAYLGGLTVAGGKLKETGLSHWVAPNAEATDETGFTVLPAGIWAFWDEFQWKGDHGAFSTSTGNLPMVEVTTIMLETSNGILTVGTFHPDDAVSVRCVKN